MKEKENWQRYPITIGEEGKDDYWLKFGDGEVIPWVSEEERQYWLENSLTDVQILERVKMGLCI